MSSWSASGSSTITTSALTPDASSSANVCARKRAAERTFSRNDRWRSVTIVTAASAKLTPATRTAAAVVRTRIELMRSRIGRFPRGPSRHPPSAANR